MKKRFVRTSITGILLLCFTLICSCSQNRFEKSKICDTLFADYTAKAEFTLSSDGNSVTGSAEIDKGETTVIEIVSPEEFSGITVKSDISGNADIICLELLGIPAKIPKSIAGNLSLMMTLFSDIIPSKLKNLDDTCFKVSEDGKSITASFSENGTYYSVSYNLLPTVPTRLEAGNENTSICMEIAELNIKENK